MSLARRALLALSTNPWLRDRATKTAFVRRSVSTFMPGERLEDAIAAAAAHERQGIGTIVTNLGENLTRVEDAEEVTRHYLDVLDNVKASGLDAQISVKPTQLGLDLDPELCFRNLQRLIDRAEARGNFVWIDMESSPYVEATLDLFRRTRARSARIGIALQAYLYRTAADVDALVPLGAAIRLVKGAYLEPASVAYPGKADVDENFYTLSVRLLREDARRPGALLHMATHDPRLVERLTAFIDQHQVPKAAYAFAMLYGIQRPLQQRLVQAGRPLRVLVAYGEYWFAWYMRRLAERPANVWFVVKNVFRLRRSYPPPPYNTGMTPPRLTLGFIVACLLAVSLDAQRPGGAPAEGLAFRFLGPVVGNRVASIAGVPGDPSIYYAGAASGGVWKTTDGGIRWMPVSDSMPVAAIGALAVAPSDPSVVWAGTGEAWAIRDSDVIGDGIYKSVDAGRTWTHMGLDETGRIGRILVHPTNPDVVFACAIGRITGPQQERGVFRTTDGGQTWERVLFVDEHTGCSGLSMDMKNPRTLFAGTWQVEMHPWAMLSGGPGSGIHVSHDGGATWSKVSGPGLPRSPLGKIDVAVAPTDSNRVYALIQTNDQGSVWRSDDGGTTWRVVNWSRELIGRAGYYIHLKVSPANEDEILVSNSSFFQSVDGGQTFRSVNWGGDNHDIWWDPKDADRFAITHDAGITITTQHGRSTQRVQLPIGQMYHVAVDTQIPYSVYSNMQDDGTMRGSMVAAENAGAGYNGSGNTWDHGLGGCESGFTIPDPADPNIVWSTCYGNKVTRYDHRTKIARSVAPAMITLDSPPGDAKYRCHWTAPIAIDPFDHTNVYYGCNVIFKTTNGGQSWNVISPDLSTQDPSRIVPSGGIVGDNLGQFAPEVIFAIAPSPVEKGLIWAGTNDGKIWYTKDGGVTWNDVSTHVTGMPSWGVVSKIEPSNFSGTTAYVAVDHHLMDSREPYIFKTTDYGATWKRVNGDLPNTHPLSYVKAVAENPNRRGMLFAGTGHGFYYSTDDGAKWIEVSTGLPRAPVSWVVVQKQFHDVVVSTYGRGLYVLDDITPLEQATAATTDAAAHLFAPRPAYRWTQRARALINYSLQAAPRGPMHLQVLDADGNLVRELRETAGAGLNRVTWDLRHEPPRLIAMRTTPAENPHIWEEPRFRGQDTRPVTHWGLDQAQVGPIVTPGTYTVKLTVDGRSSTQPLEVLKDPKVGASQADLDLSVRLQLRLRDSISAAADMVNTIEVMRKQLEDVTKAYRNDASKAALVKQVAEMDKKLFDVEAKLLEPAQMTSDDKYFQQAYRIYMNLIWLNGEVGPGAGDVAGGADFPPTDTSIGLLEGIEKELTAVKAEYKTLLDRDVPAFNRAIGGAVTPLTGRD